MMQISYFPLECELKRKKMTKTQLRKLAHLSTATISKISKDEEMSMSVLKRIAEVLDCDIKNIVEFKKIN